MDHWGEPVPPYPPAEMSPVVHRPPLNSIELSRVSPGGAALPPQLRPSNPLLVRDQVGRAKATCYDLPPINVPFGTQLVKDAEGAREVTMQWISHSPRHQPIDRTPNFRQFNKQAVKHRICTSKEREQYIRSQGEVAVVPEFSPRSPQRVLQKVVPVEATFGRKGRPSTPIEQVLAHKWGAQGEEELQDFYTAALIFKSNPPSPRKIHLTQASKGHASRAKASNAPLEEKEPFKLTKFKNVPCRLNTFRSKPPSSARLATAADIETSRGAAEEVGVSNPPALESPS